MTASTLFFSFFLFLPNVLPAQGDSKEAAKPSPSSSFPKLHFEQGKIVVGDHLATIDLPEGARYLQKKGAKFVVEKLWGNPPSDDLLGFILPKGESLKDQNSWGIVVSFENDGYINDDDASEMDFDEMLLQMQKDEAEVNEQRKKKGYPTIHLVGWAERPHYDSKTKKFYWAKEFEFEGEKDHTLNYNIRCLGRRGVLVLSAVSTMDRLKDVSTGSRAILSGVNFTEGNRYSDYVSGDKVAAYGIGALIAGKLALKAGLFKVLLKPLLILGAVVIGLFAKMFGKKKVKPVAE